MAAERTGLNPGTMVEAASLKKGDQIFVKSKRVDEWDLIVFVVNKTPVNGKGWVSMKATYTLNLAASENSMGGLESIDRGLACNMPTSANDNEFFYPPKTVRGVEKK